MQDQSHLSITGLYINNHRHLKQTLDDETVSDKFLLQYNVSARKDIKTPEKRIMSL